MPKPKTFDGYDEGYTLDCERVLVTLLRGLGPWKESVYLIGGLTPRYLVDDSGEGVPPHAGTQDVDIVIDLQILADTEAYHTLEENLKKMDFERAENDEGKKLSWRWKTKTEADVTVILELISESEELGGGKVQALPTEKTISALNVPHASMVFDLHEIKEIQAELLGENGVATEEVRFANLVSFTCLKAFAFDQRNERKDAHDLIYCLEHAPGRVTAAKEQFRKELNGKHAETVRSALDILRKRFASDEKIEGYQKDGPVAVAKFELGESNEEATKESRILRQRDVNYLIEQLLEILN
ncbi:MAG: antitoxin [Candidatus Obscuribacterales bacterium]|nr:antitoxin [Cyanobacteria bacterium HKST-UBA01]MCB9468491.1 antitoxin [Candidatus Obscuribacterales bacterium]